MKIPLSRELWGIFFYSFLSLKKPAKPDYFQVADSNDGVILITFTFDTD